jgi:hypothetical protein
MGLILVFVDVGYCRILCLWWMGRVYGVDCVCATHQLCTSANNFKDAGVSAIARSLEKNTTLQTLNLVCKFFFVFHFGCGVGFCFFVDVVCCWVVSGVDGAGVWR